MSDGPPMPLSYLTLFCRDMEASVRFYRDVLGLPARGFGPRFAWLDAGPVRLGLHAGGQDRHSSGVNLHFAVPDLGTALAVLAARGAHFEGEPTEEPWGARTARTRDPDGNEVEIIQWTREP